MKLTVEQTIKMAVLKAALKEGTALEANDHEAWKIARDERNWEEGKLAALYKAE